MSDDKKITNLADHKAKLQKRELDNSKETDSIANPTVDKEVLKDLDACIPHEDLEATLRVFATLETLGDGVTIKLDHHDIYVTIHHDPDSNIDCGVDFPEQVIKHSSTYQTSTINFNYVPEEWDSQENFIYNVAFSLRRCIESLTYWAYGDKDD